MKIFIVGGDHLIERMFLSRGWDVVSGVTDADLVCFTGGEDVSPSLYGEANVASDCDWHRDVAEMAVWHDIVGTDVREGPPCVGICRGGQFLNVMNGGKMWQHVDNHGIAGTHALELNTPEGSVTYQVTSTHHQMMIAAEGGEVIGIAERATHFYGDENHPKVKPNFDTEIVWYAGTKSLCFQPHPEYNGKRDDTEELFFNLLKQYLGVE